MNPLKGIIDAVAAEVPGLVVDIDPPARLASGPATWFATFKSKEGEAKVVVQYRQSMWPFYGVSVYNPNDSYGCGPDETLKEKEAITRVISLLKKPEPESEYTFEVWGGKLVVWGQRGCFAEMFETGEIMFHLPTTREVINEISNQLHDEAKRRKFGPYAEHRELPTPPEGWRWHLVSIYPCLVNDKNARKSAGIDSFGAFYCCDPDMTLPVSVLECLLQEYNSRPKETK